VITVWRKSRRRVRACVQAMPLEVAVTAGGVVVAAPTGADRAKMRAFYEPLRDLAAGEYLGLR
jgi:hypothetical protein